MAYASKAQLIEIVVDIATKVGNALSRKVDKVTGKGLSDENFTSEEKTKLADLSNYDDTALSGRVTTIEGKVPASASTSNKLATASDVAAKQNALTFDSTPTAGSANPVTSAGVKTALDGKQGTLIFDSSPTASSMNPVTSGGVKTALDGKAALTVTTTDPGEGSTLAANTLLIVVEE